MANKTICDSCGEEIQHSNYKVKIIKSHCLAIESGVKSFDLCKKCTKRILNLEPFEK